MIDKIYNENDDEYQSYGFYIIDGENYYSISRFKEDNDLEDNFTEKNRKEGENLNKIFNISCHKAVPEEGSYPFILVYLEEQLKDYFKV